MHEHDQLEEPTVIQHAHEWLNEHGHPSYSYLRKLADEGTIESRDQLFELAQLYDVAYDQSVTSDDLVERIRLQMDMGAEAV